MNNENYERARSVVKEANKRLSDFWEDGLPSSGPLSEDTIVIKKDEDGTSSVYLDKIFLICTEDSRPITLAVVAACLEAVAEELLEAAGNIRKPSYKKCDAYIRQLPKNKKRS